MCSDVTEKPRIRYRVQLVIYLVNNKNNLHGNSVLLICNTYTYIYVYHILHVIAFTRFSESFRSIIRNFNFRSKGL